MPKLSKPIWYLLVTVLLTAVYLQMSGGEPEAARKKKASTASKTDKLPEGLTEEDFTKRFDPLNESARNPFMPIVARMSSARDGGVEPNAIPADLAGGEPGWYFTGTAEVDGVQEACVENRTSGVGEFVRRGQTWKRVRIADIGEGTLTIVGPNGQPKTLRLSYGVNEATMANSDGIRPLDPTLRGNIGGANVGVSPENGRGRGQGRGGREVQPETEQEQLNEGF